MSIIGKIKDYIINIILDAMSTLMDLQEQLYYVIKGEYEVSEKINNEINKNTNLDVNELASTVADLIIEVRVLETRVQRLCEFRDAIGHVPIYENGGKQ